MLQLYLAQGHRAVAHVPEKFPLGSSNQEGSSVLAGTELNKVATVMSGTYRAAGEPFFDKLCLVYSRAQTQLPVKMPSPGAKP